LIEKSKTQNATSTSEDSTPETPVKVTAEEERARILGDCGFSEEWQTKNASWMKKADKQIAAYQVYAHKMGKLLAPLSVVCVCCFVL